MKHNSNIVLRLKTISDDKGKQKFRKELYTINKKEGYKIQWMVLVESEPANILKATTTANPSSDKYIQDKKEEKKKEKVIKVDSKV